MLAHLLTILALVTVLLTGMSTETAWAQSDRKAAAELLFQRGREAMTSASYEKACENFAESYRLEPAAGTAMNLATCEEKLGKTANAWDHFQQALRLLPPADDRRPYAEKRVYELEKVLPRLTVTLQKGGPKGATISRNGVELGEASWGIALPVNPGKQKVTVAARGFKKRTYKVSVAPGESAKLRVTVGKALPLPPKVEPSRSSGGANPGRTWSYVLGGVGLSGLVVAGVTGAMLPKQRRIVESRCDEGARSCDQKGAEAALTGRRLLAANTTGFIVAGVGLAAGLALFFTFDESPGGDNVKAGVVVDDGARFVIAGDF